MKGSYSPCEGGSNRLIANSAGSSAKEVASILLINQFFGADGPATACLLADLAKALAADNANNTGDIKFNLEIVPSTEMPELSIIDYLMWAVQRNLLKGESRYFDALKNKYETVLNLYGDG